MWEYIECNKVSVRVSVNATPLSVLSQRWRWPTPSPPAPPSRHPLLQPLVERQSGLRFLLDKLEQARAAGGKRNASPINNMAGKPPGKFCERNAVGSVFIFRTSTRPEIGRHVVMRSRFTRQMAHEDSPLHCNYSERLQYVYMISHMYIQTCYVFTIARNEKYTACQCIERNFVYFFFTWQQK